MNPKQPTFRYFASRVSRCLAVVFCLSAMLFAGCLETTSPDNDEYEINDVMYKIKDAFINHDINTLMLNIHTDYLHNGMSRWEMRELWLDRMAEFLLIDFQDIQIDIQDNKAVVSFTMKLQKANETIYSDEPDAHGDISYLIRDAGTWSVYGNQLNH
jgi:hypothetical protein